MARLTPDRRVCGHARRPEAVRLRGDRSSGKVLCDAQRARRHQSSRLARFRTTTAIRPRGKRDARERERARPATGNAPRRISRGCRASRRSTNLRLRQRRCRCSWNSRILTRCGPCWSARSRRRANQSAAAGSGVETAQDCLGRRVGLLAARHSSTSIRRGRSARRSPHNARSCRAARSGSRRRDSAIRPRRPPAVCARSGSSVPWCRKNRVARQHNSAASAVASARRSRLHQHGLEKTALPLLVRRCGACGRGAARSATAGTRFRRQIRSQADRPWTPRRPSGPARRPRHAPARNRARARPDSSGLENALQAGEMLAADGRECARAQRLHALGAASLALAPLRSQPLAQAQTDVRRAAARASCTRWACAFARKARGSRAAAESSRCRGSASNASSGGHDRARARAPHCAAA